MGGKSSLDRFPKKPPRAEESEKLKSVVASFRCYDNCDVDITLVITNFALYLIRLW